MRSIIDGIRKDRRPEERPPIGKMGARLEGRIVGGPAANCADQKMSQRRTDRG
jgi:hypothetical protein